MNEHLEPQPLKCLIVDDEQIAIKGIANHIGKLDFLTVTATCASALEAREILESQSIDLMFLDINMPYLSGIDFLKSQEEAPLTILTTAYSEYALEGYQLNVVDYLLSETTLQNQNTHHSPNHDFTGRDAATRFFFQNTQILSGKPVAYRLHRQRKGVHQREGPPPLSTKAGRVTANSSLQESSQQINFKSTPHEQ